MRDIDFLLQNREIGSSHDLMWKTACSAPHRFADFFDQRILVILDEFQYITQFVYPDPHFQTAPIETMAGTYHSLSESKITRFSVLIRPSIKLSALWYFLFSNPP